MGNIVRKTFYNLFTWWEGNLFVCTNCSFTFGSTIKVKRKTAYAVNVNAERRLYSYFAPSSEQLLPGIITYTQISSPFYCYFWPKPFHRNQVHSHTVWSKFMVYENNMQCMEMWYVCVLLVVHAKLGIHGCSLHLPLIVDHTSQISIGKASASQTIGTSLPSRARMLPDTQPNDSVQGEFLRNTI